MKLCLLALAIYFASCNTTAFGQMLNSIRIYDAKGRSVSFKPVKSPSAEMVNTKLNFAMADGNGNMIQFNQLNLSNPTNKKSIFEDSRLVYISVKENKTYTAAVQHWRTENAVACGKCKPGDRIKVSLKEKVYMNKNFYLIAWQFESYIPQPQYIKTTNNS